MANIQMTDGMIAITELCKDCHKWQLLKLMCWWVRLAEGTRRQALTMQALETSMMQVEMRVQHRLVVQCRTMGFT